MHGIFKDPKPKTKVLQIQQPFRRIDPYQLSVLIDLNQDRTYHRNQTTISFPAAFLDDEQVCGAGSHHSGYHADDLPSHSFDATPFEFPIIKLVRAKLYSFRLR